MHHPVKQLDLSHWDDIAYRFHVCILNYYHQDLTDKYGINFFEYMESGLGKQLGSVVSVNEHMFYLNCYFDEYVFNRIQDDPDSNNENREAIKISVYVRRFEYNSKQAFHCFCQGLRLSEKDIYYVRPDLGVARFAVYQQSNTAPINRFQTEQDAQTALNIYKKTQPNTSFFIKQENVIF